MKIEVTEYLFRDAFERMNRADQFTYTGLGTLYEVLKDLESDTGEEYELDVIALCCEWAESTLDEITVQTYSNHGEISELDDDELVEWISDQTIAREIEADQFGPRRVLYVQF